MHIEKDAPRDAEGVKIRVNFLAYQTEKKTIVFLAQRLIYPHFEAYSNCALRVERPLPIVLLTWSRGRCILAA